MATNPLKDIKDSALGKSSTFFNQVGSSVAPYVAQPTVDPTVVNASNAMPQTQTNPVVNAPQPVARPTIPTAMVATPTPTGGIDVAGIQARLAQITADALKVKTAADELAAKEKSSTTNLYRDTSNIVGEEKKTTAEVKNLTASNLPTVPTTGTTAAQTASDAYIAQLDSERAQLEERRKNEIAAIEAQFAQTKQQTETAQTKETGTMTSQLARIGGFLGGSASATGALINLATTHKNEILALEAKKASAINEANNAINDKQFALARLKAKEAKDVESEIYDRRNKFFEQSMSLSQEKRAQTKADRDAIMDELDVYKDYPPESIPQEVQTRIDTQFGIPGYTKRVATLAQESAKIKSEKERLDYSKNLISLLKDIPAGQTIPVNGVEYTGIGSAGDLQIIQETDDNGNVHMITYDKANRQIVGMQTLSGIGKTKEGAGQLSSATLESAKVEVLARAQTRLEETLGKDEKYNPENYLVIRSEAQKLDPRLVKTLDESFLKDAEIASEYFSTQGLKELERNGVVIPKK